MARAKRGKSDPPDELLIPPAAAHTDVVRDLVRLLERQQFDSADDLNAFLERNVVGKQLPTLEPANDRERAEDLVLQARDERRPARRTALINEALTLDPDCLPAYMLLAEVAPTPTEALEHARAGVASGNRALKDLIAEAAPALWLHLDARPYLMLRELVAELLWQRGDRPAAIEEARAIIRLNTGDNQGVRYTLLEWLLRAGSVADIDALLAQYREQSAMWMFATALHAFRQRGPGAEATAALRAAMRVNAHVIPMLLGDIELPDELPMAYGMGDEAEAAMYLQRSIASWYEASGAIEWAERVRATKPPGKPPGRMKRKA